MTTYRVRVKNGLDHDTAKGGDELTFNESQLAAFGDKVYVLGRVQEEGVSTETLETEAPAVDLSIYPNVDAVVDAVVNGEIRAQPALEAERNGQQRVTLIRQLEALVDGSES